MSALDAAFDDQLAAMNSQVMSPAKRDEIFGIVSTAFSAELDVVSVHVNCVPAAGNSAASAIPA